MNLIKGHLYLVDYRDPNYPCRCACHSPSRRILHVTACCRDRSWLGVSAYAGRGPDHHLFRIGPVVHYFTDEDLVPESRYDDYLLVDAHGGKDFSFQGSVVTGNFEKPAVLVRQLSNGVRFTNTAENFRSRFKGVVRVG